MEHFFYMAVRMVTAVYVLYRLYVVGYKKRFYGIWEYLLSQKKQKQLEKRPSEPVIQTGSPSSVVGKTAVVYLEDPAIVAVAPTFSIPLETTGYIDEEENVSPDEVESDLTPPLEKVLDKEELYERLDENAPGEDPELSTGLTYQQLSQAVDVLSSSSLENRKDKEVMEVAHTLYTIRGTDMFQFFASQVGNTAMIEQILEECLDGDRQPVAKRRKKILQSVKTFDIELFF